MINEITDEENQSKCYRDYLLLSSTQCKMEQFFQRKKGDAYGFEIRNIRLFSVLIRNVGYYSVRPRPSGPFWSISRIFRTRSISFLTRKRSETTHHE